MRRRDFLGTVGGAAATWPIAAYAQQTDRIRRVGVLLGVGNDAQGQVWLAGFWKALQDLNRADARNVQIDVRWGGADIDYIRASAADLVKAKPDVMLVYAVRVLNAVRQATSRNSSHFHRDVRSRWTGPYQKPFASWRQSDWLHAL